MSQRNDEDQRSADSSLSLSYAEGMLEAYLQDPSSVPEDWRAEFERFTRDGRLNGHRQIRTSLPRSPLFGPPVVASAAERFGRNESLSPVVPVAQLQHRVDEMVRSFRLQGHFFAHVNPLDDERPLPPELQLHHFGISEDDLGVPVSTDGVGGDDAQTVGEVYERMASTYCGQIGAEVTHINDLAVRAWLQDRMESTRNHLHLSRDDQLRILRKLIDAALLEEFIQKKYIGAKSFSLEGAESLIPLLDLAIERAADAGTVEIVLAMAHRGRLNVLANTIGKSTRDIFREFEDTDPEHYYGRGDVKYHMGHSSDYTTARGSNVHLSLCFNPSHLEFINPVAMGRVRAKQDRIADQERDSSMLLLIHGDAAFAGEGIVQETLNLSGLDPYTVGGTLHIIVNNQIGFTTTPEASRSNTYATDIAKMLQIPIFHVNGEYPEAVAQVVGLAHDFRRTFHRDVVIDMYCYRRRGHNEGDEPAFTQPLLYKKIRARKPVRDHYLEHLLELGEVTSEAAQRHIQEEEKRLEGALDSARRMNERARPQAYEGVWTSYGAEDSTSGVETRITSESARDLTLALSRVPDDFTPHRVIRRLLDNREAMGRGERPFDWATAEALAFASLATEGTRVRLTGQDSERGTFSQRHAMLHDSETATEHMPLAHLTADQAPVEIHNSPLCEAGVLGFEYGYSLDCPDGLVLWEAQFGDFVNTAQVVIDQFITCAEEKWNRLSGLTLLLPHGFEGQGPEHSSARLERWLTLAAEDNLQIVYPTTPAQYFHLLRRQVHQKVRKPLVVMTPKSLLRHPAVVSSIDKFTEGTFERVIGDSQVEDPATVTRILLCTGKVFYDLDQRSQETDRKDVALLRLEQLYPLPQQELEAALASFPAGAEICWVQEEPRNMGAWPHLRLNFGDSMFGRPLRGVYRYESSSPATGSASSHRLEQEELLHQAFADPDEVRSKNSQL